MEGVLVPRAAARRALVPLAGGDVGFEADDRLEARRLRLAEELDGSVQVAVIGHGPSRSVGPCREGRSGGGSTRRKGRESGLMAARTANPNRYGQTPATTRSSVSDPSESAVSSPAFEASSPCTRAPSCSASRRSSG